MLAAAAVSTGVTIAVGVPLSIRAARATSQAPAAAASLDDVPASALQPATGAKWAARSVRLDG